MKKALVVFFGGLAVAAAVPWIAARLPEPAAAASIPAPAQSAYAQVVDNTGPVTVTVFAPLYGSSPRIIAVPQASDPRSASANDRDEEPVAAVEADEPAPPRPPMVRRIRPPQPPAAVKSDGLSPVYPTPRFGGNDRP